MKFIQGLFLLCIVLCLLHVAESGVSVRGLRIKKVPGGQIYNSLNQRVTLRGVNKPGSEYICMSQNFTFDGPANAADIRSISSWGINAVRIPINEDCWLGINGPKWGGVQYQTDIKNYVDLLRANNMAAIITLAWTATGTTKALSQARMPSDHSKAAWKSITNLFKDYSLYDHVIFEVFSSPSPAFGAFDTTPAWDCWKYAGPYCNDNPNYASIPSLVIEIRNNTPSNLIMVPGVSNGNCLSSTWKNFFDSTNNTNVVASIRINNFPGTTITTTSQLTTYALPIYQAGYPVVISELAENDCSPNFINPILSWASNNYFHYMAAHWNTYDCAGGPGLIVTYEGTPTSFGSGYLKHLQSFM